MVCVYEQVCGGCPFRNLGETEYRQRKIQTFKKIIENINQKDIPLGKPIFINDGVRRRTEFSFEKKRGNLIMGFNARQTHDIVDIKSCLLLEKRLNDLMADIRLFLEDLCKVTILKKEKGGKKCSSCVQKGQIFLTACANGIDISLETSDDAQLEHRLLIADFLNEHDGIIRFSWKNSKGYSEIIAQKAVPYVNIADIKVNIPSATFLQASDESEKALIDLVLKYAENIEGNIADLFCGIGTFSYPLAKNIKNKITAADSSEELLREFKKNINLNTIPNIKVIKRNLFKYPLQNEELKNFSLVVFDPPRAGAFSQVKALAELEEKPQKIVAVSCNPHTFVNDANVLIAGGYHVMEITMVDQFNYSNHTELVALFELN